MTTAAVTSMERKLIPITGGPSRPREFLLIDMREGRLRGAYWRMRQPYDRPGANEPGQSLVDGLAADGIVASGSRKSGWWRAAAERDRLEDLLYVLLSDSRHDWQAMLLYMRSTGWGEKLP